jgi:hypothetical protein
MESSCWNTMYQVHEGIQKDQDLDEGLDQGLERN